MAEPTQHHYVPDSLQLRFGDGQGRWFYFDRIRPHLGVRPGMPGNLFMKRRLYSVTDAEGRRSERYETALSVLEGRANLVVAKIVAAARAGRTPGLTVLERRTWDRFFLVQWRRVPDIHRRSTLYGCAGREVLNALDEARAEFPERLAEVERLATPDEMARLIQNATVEAIVSGSDPVLATLAGRGVAVVHITDPRRSFILGSLPVAKLTWPDRTDLRDFAVEMWLPVASDVMVGVGQLPGTEMLIPTRDIAMIRGVNEAITLQSAAIAGRSRALIQSLAAYAPPWAQVANGAAG